MGRAAWWRVGRVEVGEEEEEEDMAAGEEEEGLV
jgi:hypothetical protein